MSALAHHYPLTTGRPHLRLLPSIAESPSVAHSVYVRRRVMAVAVATVAVIAIYLALQAGTSWGIQQLHAASSAPQVILASATSSSASTPVTYTVRPGDTLWSIARALQPTGDVRPLLGKLRTAYSGQALVPGKSIFVPQ